MRSTATLYLDLELFNVEMEQFWHHTWLNVGHGS